MALVNSIPRFSQQHQKKEQEKIPRTYFLLCSEPTAHSSTKMWFLSSCQASALLPSAAQQHLKEDSHRHSGSVTLEIQKDLSAFKADSFYIDGLGELHQTWAEARSQPLWFLGTVAGLTHTGTQ